jgi:hypothetical protein
VLGGKRDGKTSKPLSLEGGRDEGYGGPRTIDAFFKRLPHPALPKTTTAPETSIFRHYDDSAFGRFAE